MTYQRSSLCSSTSVSAIAAAAPIPRVPATAGTYGAAQPIAPARSRCFSRSARLPGSTSDARAAVRSWASAAGNQLVPSTAARIRKWASANAFVVQSRTGRTGRGPAAPVAVQYAVLARRFLRTAGTGRIDGAPVSLRVGGPGGLRGEGLEVCLSAAAEVGDVAAGEPYDVADAPGAQDAVDELRVFDLALLDGANRCNDGGLVEPIGDGDRVRGQVDGVRLSVLQEVGRYVLAEVDSVALHALAGDRPDVGGEVPRSGVRARDALLDDPFDVR